MSMPPNFKLSSDGQWWIHRRKGPNVAACPECGRETRSMAGAYGHAFIFHASTCPRYPSAVQAEQEARDAMRERISVAMDVLGEYGVTALPDQIVATTEQLLAIADALRERDSMLRRRST